MSWSFVESSLRLPPPPSSKLESEGDASPAPLLFISLSRLKLRMLIFSMYSTFSVISFSYKGDGHSKRTRNKRPIGLFSKESCRIKHEYLRTHLIYCR